MSSGVKQRNSNIELLRIIAMFSVVISHIVVHCIIPQWRMQGAFSLGKKMFLVNMMISWGNISNDLFLVISGYFLIEKEGNINIINISKKLLLQLFYSVAMLVFVANALYSFVGHNNRIHMVSIMDINSSSWYIGYYFSVIVIAALGLNIFLCRLEKENYLKILIVVFSVITFSWSADFLGEFGGNGGIKQLLTGLFLYAFGGYIKKYEPFKKVRVFTFLLLIFIFYFLLFVATINFDKIVHNFDQSFFAIISAICIFEIFRRINLSCNSVVNFLGTATFMVYLFHDNSFFYKLWDAEDWVRLLSESPVSYCSYLLIYGLLTFSAGVFCYITYLLFMKVLGKLRFFFISNS